jgi:hypothetical protein
MARRGPKPILDATKRGQIVAIISVGCSQKVAAEFVGCHVSTIQRSAERDPKFAAELHQANGNAELSLVRNIRNAAKKEQYWRAAAWALERFFPEKSARRGPDVITLEQIGLLLAKFCQIIVESVPEKYRSTILKKADALALGLGITLKQETADEPQ